jgi:phage gp37-like protein
MIAATEAAYLARITEVLGTSIRKPEAIGGAWTAAELQRALNNAPTVRIAFAGGSVDTERHSARLTAEWVLHVVSRAPTEEARRLGGPQTIGAYEMLRRLLPAVHSYTFAGIGTAYVYQVDNLFDEAHVYQIDNLFDEAGFDVGGAVYSIRTRIVLDLPGEDVAAGLARFAHFHADYDIPPFTPDHHAAWLAEDHTSAPDAQDDVSISQP